MNTKLLDPLPESLVDVKLPFGSRVYGTHNDSSDYDYLVILRKSVGDMRLQYQMNDGFFQIDYIYTDWDQFYKDLETGSSPIAFEVLHSSQDIIQQAPLDYYTYENAKMYLGLAKRDLAYPERINHVRRCIHTADKIMDKSLIDLEDPIPGWLNIESNKLREIIKDRRQELNKQYKKT